MAYKSQKNVLMEMLASIFEKLISTVGIWSLMKTKAALILMLIFSSLSVFAGTKIIPNQGEYLQEAAYVDYVEYIKGQNKAAKIFSVSGGDPAMNGAHLYLAVFVSGGWNVFELANVRDFKLLPSAKPDFLKIKLTRDSFDKDDNNIQVSSVLFINIKNSEKVKNASIEIEEVEKK